MIRGSLVGLFTAIGLSFVPFVNVVGPLVGGLIGGFIANRGFLGGLVAGTLMTALLLFPLIGHLTGVTTEGVIGQFPGMGRLLLHIVPTVVLGLMGGSIGGLLRELPRLRDGLKKSPSSSYYKR